MLQVFLFGVHLKITRRPTMKTLTNIYEAIIIVLLIAILLVPEMLYFAVDRAIEKIREVAGEL